MDLTLLLHGHEKTKQAEQLVTPDLRLAIEASIGNNQSHAVFVEALRKKATGDIKKYLVEADHAYWSFLGQFERWVQYQAFKHARRLRLDREDAETAVRLGAYRAALRFRPEEEVKFTTYAKYWVYSAVNALKTKEQDIVTTSNSVAAQTAKKTERFDELTLDWRFADTTTDTEEQSDLTILRDILPERELAVLVAFAAGKSGPEIATAMGISRQRVHALRLRAEQRINAWRTKTKLPARPYTKKRTKESRIHLSPVWDAICAVLPERNVWKISELAERTGYPATKISLIIWYHRDKLIRTWGTVAQKPITPPSPL
jgi:RNA polymerase sigma factor (sigma-70 family)